MAVEVTSKQLHRHAVPIVMIILGVLLFTIAAWSRYDTQSLQTEARLGRGLVTRVVHVKPTANGLAKVTVETDSTPPEQTLPVDEAGRTAQLSLIMQFSKD